jgi:ADP-ribose pyrophosphatase YjhB (NUDIX family)
MSRSSLIEHGNMHALGFRFHHAVKSSASKVHNFATHNVGVGAVVVNSRNEILCVRELGTNYLPWKIPTGLSDLGESIGDVAVREVLEEIGIVTRFHSILSFRQTHGLTHGRSELFFLCRLDPVELEDGDGNNRIVIPEPQAQACEIETERWVPLDEYRAIIQHKEHGHPMMRNVMDMFDA